MWDERKFMKTIFHQREDIPILTVNEGFKSTKSFMSEMKPLPFKTIPSYLHTSKTKMKKKVRFECDKNEMLIIPNDDEDLFNDDLIHDEIDPFFPTCVPCHPSVSEEIDSELEDSEIEDEKIEVSTKEVDLILKLLHAPKLQIEEEFRLIHEKLKHLPES